MCAANFDMEGRMWQMALQGCNGSHLSLSHCAHYIKVTDAASSDNYLPATFNWMYHAESSFANETILSIQIFVEVVSEE